MAKRSAKLVTVPAALALLVLGGYLVVDSYLSDFDNASESLFRRTVVDVNGPRDPWGKSVGDTDGDGLPDLVIGGHEAGELVWYRNPQWTKHAIAGGEAFGTDHEIADIDGDGRRDVVSITGSDLRWYRNDDWRPSVISKGRLHDIEIADLDGDGDMDIVGRNQGAFRDSGASVVLFEQVNPDLWRSTAINVSEGEGLRVADMNDDRRPDIVVNGVWFENLRPWAAEGWRAHDFAGAWTWPHTVVDVGDFNGDRRPDIVLAPAERAGDRYRLSWFEAPSEGGDSWAEHIIARDVEAVMHFVGLGDMDGYADFDVVGAEMHQGADPDDITMYFNGRGGQRWFPEVVSVGGSHSMRLVDLDRDGDLDMFGANWPGESQAVQVWENRTCPGSGPWRRHVVDGELPWTAVLVVPADLDRDGLMDIAAGAWRYRNPGLTRHPWERRRIGTEVHQVAAVLDLDGDRYPDLIATTGKDGVYGEGRLSATYNGAGGPGAWHPIAEVEGDFLQGAAVGDFQGVERPQLALSWHAAGKGIQLLTPQVTGPNGGESMWAVETISPMSQDEALSAGDIDNDGDLDLLLGTKWLRNDATSWFIHSLASTESAPDRNRLADLNADGRLDAVIGFEAINVAGDLVWYEQPTETEDLWRRHDIAVIVGPMSLDVADIDRDGDLDVISGEHNTANPEQAGLFWFANLDGKGQAWKKHLIYRGDEHHDGAQSVDIDGDGDLDVVSIGWGHSKLLVYETLRNACGVKD